MNKKPTSIKSSEQESFLNVDPANVEIKVAPEQSFSPVDPDYPYPETDVPEVSNEVLGIPTPSAETARIASMPDEWKERNKIMVEARAPLVEDTVNVPVDVISRPTDVPIVEFSALREPSPSYAKVGYPVLFGGEYAAIITKVWDSGLVNLIVFSAEHPVSDIKTRVSYGEGPNTWKEID